MRTWRVTDLDLGRPQILSSSEDSRVIALHLGAGERLAEHQVDERAWILPVSGGIRVSRPGATAVRGGPGMVVELSANERHEVVAEEDARLLLLLTSWPGPGHPRGSVSTGGAGEEDPWSLDPLSPLP